MALTLSCIFGAAPARSRASRTRPGRSALVRAQHPLLVPRRSLRRPAGVHSGRSRRSNPAARLRSFARRGQTVRADEQSNCRRPASGRGARFRIRSWVDHSARTRAGVGTESDDRYAPRRADAAVQEPSLPSSGDPRPSVDSGTATQINFENQTNGVVEIFWIDTDGQRHPYQTLKPGDRFEQPTYVGHVWLVTDQAGKTLGVYQAVKQRASAIIGANRPGQRRRRAP